MAHLTHRRQHRARMRERALRRNLFTIKLKGWEEFDATISAAEDAVNDAIHRQILGSRRLGASETRGGSLAQAEVHTNVFRARLTVGQCESNSTLECSVEGVR